MLIRHITFSRRDKLMALVQPPQIQSEQASLPYSSYLTKTLNPEEPVQQVLIDELNPKNENFPQKEPSQFSFKDNACLRNQRPLEIQQPLKCQQNNPYDVRICSQQTQRRLPSTTSSQKGSKQSFLRRPGFTRIIKFNHKDQMTSKTNSPNKIERDNSELYDKPIPSYTAKNKFHETLQQFKSLRMQKKQESKPIASQRYTYTKPENAKVQSTNASQSPTEKGNSIQIVLLNQIKRQRGDIFNSSINEKKKNYIPNEEETSNEKETSFVFPHQQPLQKIYKRSQDEQAIACIRPSKTTQSANKQELKQSRSNKSQTIHISIKTSLLQLKEICLIQQLQTYNVQIKIPQIFSTPLFNGQQQQCNIFDRAKQILASLQMAYEGQVFIKKYSNCVMIIVSHIAIISHFSGKIYIGGWRAEGKDGCKSGLGFEWLPNKYVYYGQFQKNKRDGVGLLKNMQNQILAGLWRQNKFISSLNPN